MSTPDLAGLLEEYRAGLESQLILLVHLQEIAARQHETTKIADIDALKRAADRRDALTADLMAIEQQLRPLRDRLTREPEAARHLPGFSHAVALYQTIARMVADVLETDGHSIRALQGCRRSPRRVHEADRATLAAAARGRAARTRRWSIAEDKDARSQPDVSRLQTNFRLET